jgi:hypothetical protein
MLVSFMRANNLEVFDRVQPQSQLCPENLSAG